MRLHLLGLLLLGISTSALSQRVAIQGKLLDENNEGLVGATVTLQNQSDSVMVAFSVTDSEGNFSMEDKEKSFHQSFHAFGP